MFEGLYEAQRRLRLHEPGGGPRRGELAVTSLPSGSPSRDEEAQAATVAVCAEVPIALAPLPSEQRIEVVDALRGFALLGILLVNMAFFAGPWEAILVETPLWPAAHDRAATWLIGFLATSKFYSLFSFLFGFGIYVQMERAAQRQARFGTFYVRRLLILLVVGAAHATLVWSGDILMLYAILGLVLWWFRRRKPKTLLVWAALLLLLPVLFMAACTGLLALAKFDPTAAAQVEAARAAQQQDVEQALRVSLAAYRDGSFGDILRQRLVDLRGCAFFLAFMAPSVLGMFLLGLLAGQRGYLSNAGEHLRFFRRVVIWGLVLGVIGNLVYATGLTTTSLLWPTPALLATFAGGAVGAPALCLFYAAALILLWQRPAWQRRLRPLTAVGRMSLTNYLLQSIVCTTIFYSYGLGLFGRVGPATGVALAVLIYLAQIALSHWWVRHYRFGPMEWLWRSLAYMRPAALRAGAVA